MPVSQYSVMLSMIPSRVRPPAGLPSTTAREIFQAPRSWAEKVYPNLVYFNQVDKGGHFAAWEQPQIFSEEMRAAFRPLRRGN